MVDISRYKITLTMRQMSLTRHGRWHAQDL